jgi:AcrR family transcriptional regulator
MSSDNVDTKTQILEATRQLMEQQPGKNVSMGDIAKAVGISRQAVYLHFASRTELLIATTHYVDEIKGLNKRLEKLQAAKTAVALLEMCVEIWGHYIPEIYGIAKALMMTKQDDEAAAAAWNDSMRCLRDVCEEIIDALERDKLLASGWERDEAVEMLWTVISINNWEQLTHECGWSTGRYVEMLKIVLKSALVRQ